MNLSLIETIEKIINHEDHILNNKFSLLV